MGVDLERKGSIKLLINPPDDNIDRPCLQEQISVVVRIILAFILI